MIDYAAIAIDAQTAVQEAGTKLTITRASKTYDPVTTESVSAPELTGEFDVVILPAKKANAIAGFQVGFDNSYAEKLRAGKVRGLLIAGNGAPFEPKQGDVATFSGAVWELLGCTPLDPALNAPLIYKTEVVQQ